MSASRGGWRERPPEPSRLWIRWAPALWPGPEEPWIDLAAGRLGASEPPASGWSPLPAALEPDVLYLPPVAPELAAERHALARVARERGHAVIWQAPPGPAPEVPEGAVAAWDLLAAVTGAAAWPAAALPAGGVALWPLAPGIGGTPESWAAGLARLAAAGVEAVAGVVLDLAPADRRRLAARTDEPFSGPLFHGAAPDWRRFAGCVRASGLAWGLPRPAAPRPLALQERNREVAGLFAEAAERWAEAGEPEAAGQELWRAAREAERSGRDLAALAREGQVGLLPWLGGERRRFVEEWAAGGRPRLLVELEERLGHGAGRRPMAGPGGER